MRRSVLLAASFVDGALSMRSFLLAAVLVDGATALSAPPSALVPAVPAVRRLTRCVESRADLSRAGGEATFLSASGVPSVAVDDGWCVLDDGATPRARARPLAGAEDHAIVVDGALSKADCAALVAAAERTGLVDFDVGKNRHAALQVLAPASLEAVLASRIAEFVPAQLNGDRFANFLSARLRFYRYAADGAQEFRAHLDAGFAASAAEGETLVLDAHDGAFVSRYSALFYLTEDFAGGETTFFDPGSGEAVASVKPATGRCLLIKQALESEMPVAQATWPSHGGTPLRAGGAAKYVIRADCMFAVFDRHADKVRATFTPQSPVFDKRFLLAVEPLYSPHMGVENAAALLYGLVRFVKPRSVVEIGAGYTSLWILRALRDNDDDLARIRALQLKGQCRLLDWPWCVDLQGENGQHRSTLRCIDNCAHQTATAGGVAAVAHEVGLDGALEFVQGDAFDVDFGPESMDLFWLDFGVGDRVADFAARVFPALRPGGLLVCHSTLTNRATRAWLEAVRAGASETETGVPPGEVHHLSLLEPHKHFQNALTILQRRPTGFAEPIYSENA